MPIPSDATLNRFFALHVIALPLVLLLLVVLHLGALHEVGSNNPDGVEIKKGPKGNRWSTTAPTDGIPFHPYYTVKDLVGVGFFLILAAFIIFFAPTFGGWFLEHDNFTEANRLVTPEHIKPVWYFTPYYAMLRVVPSFFGTPGFDSHGERRLHAQRIQAGLGSRNHQLPWRAWTTLYSSRRDRGHPGRVRGGLSLEGVGSGYPRDDGDHPHRCGTGSAKGRAG